MKPKILVTREIFDDVLDYLKQHFEVTSNQADTPMDAETLAKNLADKTGAMTTLVDRVDAKLLSRCPTLKAVCNIAVGFNNIDLAACSSAGVMATNTPGVLDDSTADFTWALILSTARRVVESDAHVRAGQWKGWYLKQFLGADVHHATLGILGFGRIGRRVARRALGFDMTVLYHDTQPADAATERSCNAAFVSMDELLARADILTIHIPYAPATHHLVSGRELGKMKPGAILIHASRGGVVDDAALVEALKSGRAGRGRARRLRERAGPEPGLPRHEKRGPDAAHRQLLGSHAPRHGDAGSAEPGGGVDHGHTAQSPQPLEKRRLRP